ncbi:MAG: NOB1 family endonuclease [Candidatus Methanofastidiosia archaeon]
MKFVLDSCAIFADLILDGKCCITPDVLDEIKDVKSKNIVNSYTAAGKIRIMEASKESIDEVGEKVSQTGDLLSMTDISIIALAKDLDATIFTDDYGIQNVAQLLGVRWLSPKTAGIKKVFIWRKKCLSCGREYSLEHEGCCEVCGGVLKRFVKI